jgi:hopene-associated glycosyltransferase HpnB
MQMIWSCLVFVGAAIWFFVVLVPWRPWSTRESLDADPARPEADLSDITVLIPARNEAETIQQTLQALRAQGRHLRIIVIDDQSTDRTAELARAVPVENLELIHGRPLPEGWSGKQWALEQGRQQVHTPLILLTDADIEMKPGILNTLYETMRRNNLRFISLMAELRMRNFWERLLMPAFVYFFKLLYPFQLANSPSCRVAAAAGGCILLETSLLAEIGGFHPVRGELIDDCALARRVKSRGCKTWVGLSHSVRSLRAYRDLDAIWHMVARTAFTQLRYSCVLLVLCTVVMCTAFWVPLGGLFSAQLGMRFVSAAALSAMLLTYVPTLRFYRLSPWWTFTMPLIAILYLAMTWSSAIGHWRGRGFQWKGRAYMEKRPGRVRGKGFRL